MPNFNDTIYGFGCGDDLAVQRTINNIPADLTIDVAWFYVKRELTDSDAAAIINKRITVTETADGQITDDGANDTSGQVIFFIERAKTALLEQPCYFEIKVQTSDGSQYASNRGVIRGEGTVINTAS